VRKGQKIKGKTYVGRKQMQKLDDFKY